MGAHLSRVIRAFTQVFAHMSYIVLGSSLALIAFVFSVWLPNIRLIADVFATSSAPISAKLKVAVSLLGGIGTNFSALSASYTIAIAILFGITAAMVVYLVRKEPAALRGNTLATGLGGMGSGIFGVGCAACGSLFVSSILSSFGAVGALALLPLRGGEFGLLSVVLLAVSLSLVSKKITDPSICKP